MASHFASGRREFDAGPAPSSSKDGSSKERLETRGVSRAPFRVEPHDFGFDPRLNLDKALQIADELECLEATKKLGS